MSAERVGVLAWIGLVALQFAWYLVIAPPAAGSAWIALTLTLPALLLPLFALRTNLRRALLWLGVVALFYFCHGVVAAWAPPPAPVPAPVGSAPFVIAVGNLRRGGRRGP